MTLLKKRSLLEICKDIASQPGALEDPEGTWDMAMSLIHDHINETWGAGLEKNFDEALDSLKIELRPLKDLVSEADLRRVLGQEIAWIRRSARMRGPVEVLRERRADFVSEAIRGPEPLTDPTSPTRRLGELRSYLRSWRDSQAYGFGIPTFDDSFGGILPGEVCILVGAPGAAKTSLALSAVDDFVSRRDDGSVTFVSLDMSARSISMRLMEHESGLSEGVLRGMEERGDPEFDAIQAQVSSKYDGRLSILSSDREDLDLTDVLDDIELRGPKLIVIDYLTLLKRPGESDLDCVERVIPQIRRCAQRYQIAVIVLSQMSRTSRADQAQGRIGGHSKGGGISEERADLEIELIKHRPADGGPAKVIAGLVKSRRGDNERYFELGIDWPSRTFDGTGREVRKVSPVKVRSSTYEPVGYYGGD